MIKHYALVQNSHSGRCHMLHANGLPYCGTKLHDDDRYRHKFPKDGIACGSCLRVRRRMRRGSDGK